MENPAQPAPDDEIPALREAIKRKYQTYHLKNRDRFPEFDYNTNRANYESLRTSFDEEFYTVRGLDRTNPNIHIPSTNTLALLFTDNTYVPGRKILNTCRSYAHEQAALTPQPTAPDQSHTRSAESARRLRIGLVIAVVVALSIAVFRNYRQSSAASGLIIVRPFNGQTVPRMPLIEGKVTNADTVWIVVHPIGRSTKFYVQPPARVNTDGSWRQQIFIGTADRMTDGHPFEIRAFVRPPDTYKAIDENESYMFDAWPTDAELTTGPTVVIRGPEPVNQVK